MRSDRPSKKRKRVTLFSSRLKVSGRERVLLIAWLAIVAVFLLNWAGRNAASRIADLNEAIQSNEAKLMHLNAVLERSDRIEAAYERVNTSLSDIGTLEGLLSRLTEIAQGSGFRITNMSPGEAEVEQGLRVYPVTIEARNDEVSLARFLFAVVSEFKAVEITQVSARKPSLQEPMDTSIVLRIASRSKT